MKKVSRYFDRDISWLSFNYRVLLESEDDSLPIFERLKFLSIHASNLEEFYKIRVADHRSQIMKKVHSEEDTTESEKILEKIKREVTRQQKEFSRIFRDKIKPELKRQNIIIYLDKNVNAFHRDFVRKFFWEEVFPFLQPVMILKDDIRIFIRDNRLYLVVKLIKKTTEEEQNDQGKIYYCLIKLPYSKVSRFIELPRHEDKYYFMFVDDMIIANLEEIFPGFVVDGSYEIKISRDADIYIDEEPAQGDNLVETIKKKVKKRKIGDLSRFVHDRRMPGDFRKYLSDAFDIYSEDMIPDNAHLSMEDLIKLPNPAGKELEATPFVQIRIPELDGDKRILQVIRKHDVFVHYPYHTFDYFIRFLMEAGFNPNVEEIKITQYRVAENSEVISSLINAARNGKKVTVFVELKARFDEENNLNTAEAMKQAGIRIIYSLPGLKVHAKVALVSEKKKEGALHRRSYAYLSTGNFNEKTARLYSDMAVFTCNRKLTEEIDHVFQVLEGEKKDIDFKQVLVAQFNLVPELKQMIRKEINHVKQGRKGRIILKMNGLQDPVMIEELYAASEAGVEIDLIIRGICCLVPGQPFSRNIRVTRIVDKFLEHARVWYFYDNGKEHVYLTSADWMKRNLYRRIETAFPVLDKGIRQNVIDILNIQLQDNMKACWIDKDLNNIFKKSEEAPHIWAQKEIYNYLLK